MFIFLTGQQDDVVVPSYSVARRQCPSLFPPPKPHQKKSLVFIYLFRSTASWLQLATYSIVEVEDRYLFPRPISIQF